jgi:hypothetical protein
MMTTTPDVWEIAWHEGGKRTGTAGNAEMRRSGHPSAHPSTNDHSTHTADDHRRTMPKWSCCAKHFPHIFPPTTPFHCSIQFHSFLRGNLLFLPWFAPLPRTIHPMVVNARGQSCPFLPLDVTWYNWSSNARAHEMLGRQQHKFTVRFVTLLLPEPLGHFISFGREMSF